ncbi:OmpP1/FadL family transporter [Thioalkalivibrio sp.]|uniref:OmpP1/FadL family transporter n=1 Tax=Thioalkalivibrio sp. TaxID=2093813 RepID=UPI0035612FD2
MADSRSRRSLVALAVSATLGLSGTAHATNGFFSHGYGTQTKGMGGVGMAISHDSYAPGTNPAGIAGMETRFDGSLAYFRPERFYEAGEPQFQPPPPNGFPLKPGRVDSNSESFFIPSLGYVRQIDADRSWGVTLLANGGLNTDYPAFDNPDFCPPQSPQQGTFCFGEAGVNLEQLALIPTYAQRFADGRVSVGVSPIISFQRFRAKGLQAFSGFSADPENLTNASTDSDFGFGGQIGFQAQLADHVRVGANYRSKIRGSTFDDFSGLFAENGDLDIPETWGLGIAVDVTPRITVAADYQRINYSDVPAVNNPFSNLFDGNLLGEPNGPGFGWEDIDIFKIGAEFAGDNGWTWRAGYNRGENPIPRSEVLFNILAPGVMEDHFTVGFSKAIDSRSAIHLAAMYAPSASVTGTNPLDGQTIKLEMEQYELEIGYSYRF